MGEVRSLSCARARGTRDSCAESDPPLRALGATGLAVALDSAVRCGPRRLPTRHRRLARALQSACERRTDTRSDVAVASSEVRQVAGCKDRSRAGSAGRGGYEHDDARGTSRSVFASGVEGLVSSAEVTTPSRCDRTASCHVFSEPVSPESVGPQRRLHLLCHGAQRPSPSRRARPDDRAAPSIVGMLEAADAGQYSDCAGRQLPVADRGEWKTPGERPAGGEVHLGPRRARDDPSDPRRL